MTTEPARLPLTRSRRAAQRRHERMRRRLLPLAAVALIAFVVGIVEAGGSSGDQRRLVQRYVRDWQHSRYSAMYLMLDPASRRSLGEAGFVSRLESAARTATVESIRPTRIVSVGSSQARVDFTIRTRIFGTLREPLLLALDSSDAPDIRVRFTGYSVFPGLRPGERLSRVVTLGRRGSLLASDGQMLAEGSSLGTAIPTVAGEIVGTLGAIPASERSAYERDGYPAHARVGQDGLEAIFQRRLAGMPGGKLLAGRRVLASSRPVNGATVHTTINPGLETDALTAMGSHYAGITVLNPDGAIEAATGIAFTDVQPPGSTFKIITSTAALGAGLTSLYKTYPMESSASVGGFIMQNAAGEVCGGTLINAFASSCDTTFAPLGIQVGASRLVAEAEKYGFNAPVPGVSTATESTIPSVAKIGDAASVGASAIGQGKVQASTLQMADAAATIADGGRRPLPTMNASAKPAYVDVTTPQIAADIRQMMIAVVTYSDGTGHGIAIPGVEVAGKTGTAELRNTAGQVNDTKETDSWFVAFAPANDPKVVVCALFPNAGYGAAVAAPAVREIVADALGLQQ